MAAVNLSTVDVVLVTPRSSFTADHPADFLLIIDFATAPSVINPALQSSFINSFLLRDIFSFIITHSPSSFGILLDGCFSFCSSFVTSSVTLFLK